MRPIKFRAWDKERKEWAYFTLLQLQQGQTSKLWTKLCNWCQFTGRLDKNGKEIYEGDIVRGIVKRVQLCTWDNDDNCNTKMAGVVNYDHHCYNLSVVKSMCDKDRDGMVNYFDFTSTDDGDFEEMEVIGNIFENKELLQSENI